MAEARHTTAQIREHFAWFERDASSKRIAEEVFDRWLAGVRAEVWDAALASIDETWGERFSELTTNPYREEADRGGGVV